MSVSKDNSNFEQILDSCLSRMQAGETIVQCLADYPDSKDVLRPLLLAAKVVQAAPQPAARPQAVAQGQTRMLAALNGRNQETAVSFGSLLRYAERIRSILKQEEASQMRVALRSVVTTVLILFVSGFLALIISANSLPGEPFYPVKRGWESARLGLTFDPEARQQLEGQIQQTRQQELAALIEIGRQTLIVYEGYLEQIEEGQLIVDDFPFETNDDTLWRLDLEIGEAVKIETEITSDGRLVALEISAGSLDSRPQLILTATATPCNTPACTPPTPTSTPCNVGACGPSTPTPIPSNTPGDPTPTPCNTPACSPPTATPTPCNVGACGPSTPTPVPSNTPGGPTPTPCNTPACSPPTASPTPCNTGACTPPSPTPPPTNTPGGNPPPTPTPCNTPACAPPTATPTPCNAGACGPSSPTPPPTSTPGDPTPTPCNTPACAPPTATPTPCNAGACSPSTPTPIPTNTPGDPDPTPTPCNTPGCAPPTATPTPCNLGACIPPPSTPSPTPCNVPACGNLELN